MKRKRNQTPFQDFSEKYGQLRKLEEKSYILACNVRSRMADDDERLSTEVSPRLEGYSDNWYDINEYLADTYPEIWARVKAREGFEYFGDVIA